MCVFYDYKIENEELENKEKYEVERKNFSYKSGIFPFVHPAAV